MNFNHEQTSHITLQQPYYCFHHENTNRKLITSLKTKHLHNFRILQAHQSGYISSQMSLSSQQWHKQRMLEKTLDVALRGFDWWRQKQSFCIELLLEHSNTNKLTWSPSNLSRISWIQPRSVSPSVRTCHISPYTKIFDSISYRRSINFVSRLQFCSNLWTVRLIHQIFKWNNTRHQRSHCTD
jgi:hypothetical protein